MRLPVCNSRANEMKIRFGDINYFSGLHTTYHSQVGRESQRTSPVGRCVTFYPIQ